MNPSKLYRMKIATFKRRIQTGNYGKRIRKLFKGELSLNAEGNKLIFTPIPNGEQKPE